MEIDRPTGADYASNAAAGAQAAADGAWENTRALEERVGVLEAKVKALFLVIDYMVGGDKLNSVQVNDDTGEINICRAYD